MIDTNNKNIRRVQTPIGEGTLSSIDPDTGKYQVKVLKKDCTVAIESPCLFKFYSEEELDELPAN